MDQQKEILLKKIYVDASMDAIPGYLISSDIFMTMELFHKNI